MPYPVREHRIEQWGVIVNHNYTSIITKNDMEVKQKCNFNPHPQ